MEQILDTETLQRRLPDVPAGSFRRPRAAAGRTGDLRSDVSYAVAQRTREIGIRMALGAERRQVLRMVIGEGMVLALLGVGLGVAAAFGSHAVASLLFGTAANNAFACGSVSGLLPGVALAACFIPARRALAGRADCSSALRVTRRLMSRQ